MNAATKLPGELGPIHFIGIGGIGMSGIAEVLMTLGYDGAGVGREEIQDHRPAGRLGRAVL
jgi:UDP-N-acetylmuramate--alanine ligase